MTDEIDWQAVARDAMNRLKTIERAVGDPQHPRWDDRTPDPRPEGYRTQRERISEILDAADPYQPELDDLPVGFTDGDWDAVYFANPMNRATDHFEREAEARVMWRIEHECEISGTEDAKT